MDILVNSILCLVQDFLATLFGLLNETLGSVFGFELEVPDVGCES